MMRGLNMGMRGFMQIVENARKGYDAMGFIQHHGGRVLAYDELPEPAQKAVYQYMQIDGEADDYADIPYGYAEVPAEAVFEFVNHYFRTEYGEEDSSSDWATGELSFEPSYPKESVWPVIISRMGFEDGSHRLERYAKLGLKTIPVVAIGPRP